MPNTSHHSDIPSSASLYGRRSPSPHSPTGVMGYRRLYLYSTLLLLAGAVAVLIGAMFGSLLAVMTIAWVILVATTVLSAAHTYTARQNLKDIPPRNVTYLSGTDVVKAIYAHIFDASTPVEDVDRWVELLGSLYGDAWDHREKLEALSSPEGADLEEEKKAFVEDWERKLEGG